MTTTTTRPGPDDLRGALEEAASIDLCLEELHARLIHHFAAFPNSRPFCRAIRAARKKLSASASALREDLAAAEDARASSRRPR